MCPEDPGAPPQAGVQGRRVDHRADRSGLTGAVAGDPSTAMPSSIGVKAGVVRRTVDHHTSLYHQRWLMVAFAPRFGGASVRDRLSRRRTR